MLNLIKQNINKTNITQFADLQFNISDWIKNSYELYRYYFKNGGFIEVHKCNSNKIYRLMNGLVVIQISYIVKRDSMFDKKGSYITYQIYKDGIILFAWREKSDHGE